MSFQKGLLHLFQPLFRKKKPVIGWYYWQISHNWMTFRSLSINHSFLKSSHTIPGRLFSVHVTLLPNHVTLSNLYCLTKSMWPSQVTKSCDQVMWQLLCLWTGALPCEKWGQVSCRPGSTVHQPPHTINVCLPAQDEWSPSGTSIAEIRSLTNRGKKVAWSS